MALAAGLALVIALAFSNGANDVSKSVASLVGSGVTDCRRALHWGAAWTVAGALTSGFVGVELAERFARSLTPAADQPAAVPLAVIVAALAWVAFASRAGLPVSTTHALAGAILGVGWAADGLTPWSRTDVLEGFFIPLLASPPIAVGCTLLLGSPVRRLAAWLDSRCVCAVTQVVAVEMPADGRATSVSTSHVVVSRTEECEGRATWTWNPSSGQVHWLSSGLVAFSRSVNDAPKIWALLLPFALLGGRPGPSTLALGVAVVALGMGLGSWAGGRRVTDVLAHRVSRMGTSEGLCANIVTALLVAGASPLGLPVSTTHVSAGAIVGIGLGKGRSSVNWRIFKEMALAWIVTLPAGGMVAVAGYWMFK